MVWEEILETYDMGEEYDRYIREFIEENIPSDVLEETLDAYRQSGETDSTTFEFWLSEHGFANGTQVVSVSVFYDDMFPDIVLADQIEQYMFHNGEYAIDDAERFACVDPLDRYQTYLNVRAMVNDDPAALLAYFKNTPVKDEISAVLTKELQERCGEFAKDDKSQNEREMRTGVER